MAIYNSYCMQIKPCEQRLLEEGKLERKKHDTHTKHKHFAKHHSFSAYA